MDLTLVDHCGIVTIRMQDDTFVFSRYSFDPSTGCITLVYTEGPYTFVESLTVPMDGVDLAMMDRDALDRALFLLHLLAGISYWKTACPAHVTVASGTLTNEQSAFFNTTYLHGLGEFFYRNRIDPRGRITFPVTQGAVPPTLRGPREHKLHPLVTVGGGKDSIVTAELLKRQQIPMTLLVVKDAEPIRATGQQIGHDRLVIKRRIDPALVERSKQPGTYNGHVPITAILMAVSVVVAILHHKNDVLFSLERSAEEGNLLSHGLPVNHQFSKTLAFERAFQDYLATFVTRDVRVFSIIRPLSELHIAKLFTDHPAYLPLFSSCNRNFSFAATQAGQRTFWCGNCPKCVFTFILLSAWIPRALVIRTIGQDLFLREDLLETVRELLGIRGHKPFECVGEAQEVAAAMELAYRRGDANDTPAMQVYIKEVRDQFNDPDTTIQNLMTPSSAHAIPSDYLPVIETL